VRKLLVGLLALSVILFLFGCKDDDEENTGPSEEEKVSEIMDSNKRVDEDQLKVGDEISNEHGDFIIHKITTEEVETEEIPVNVKISRMLAASGEVKGSFVGILGKEVLDYIEFDVRIENITDEIINFPIVKAKMITNTGEEIDSGDILLSDFVPDEIRSQVYVHGKFYYVLEDTKAEDVESVQIIWDSPVNEAGETMGKDVEIEVVF